MDMSCNKSLFITLFHVFMILWMCWCWWGYI